MNLFTFSCRVRMQLTKFSDYALQVLMYVHGARERLVTIEEMAASYRISRAHLMKVVNSLTRSGYLTAVRGRSGGLWLGRPIRSDLAMCSAKPNRTLRSSNASQQKASA